MSARNFVHTDRCGLIDGLTWSWMCVELPNDILNYIEATFSPEQRDEALHLLGQAKTEEGGVPSPRLLRCVAFACRGNLLQLQRLASLLAVDWRDVIVAGEYELRNQVPVQIRDFRQSLKI